jgi:hypothetical protein
MDFFHKSCRCREFEFKNNLVQDMVSNGRSSTDGGNEHSSSTFLSEGNKIGL